MQNNSKIQEIINLLSQNSNEKIKEKFINCAYILNEINRETEEKAYVIKEFYKHYNIIIANNKYEAYIYYLTNIRNGKLNYWIINRIFTDIMKKTELYGTYYFNIDTLQLLSSKNINNVELGYNSNYIKLCCCYNLTELTNEHEIMIEISRIYIEIELIINEIVIANKLIMPSLQKNYEKPILK
jgi:hypothetical protein